MAFSTTTGFRVAASLCREDARLSHVKLTFDLPGAPEGFVLEVDRSAAIAMADSLRKAVATIERAEHGRDDA